MNEKQTKKKKKKSKKRRTGRTKTTRKKEKNIIIIDPDIVDGLITINPRAPKFYMSPKIHTPNNSRYPVKSSVDCHTSNISRYVDYHQNQPPEVFYENRCFLVNFAKFLRTLFHITPPND